jgi:hypothetical protein
MLAWRAEITEDKGSIESISNVKAPRRGGTLRGATQTES